MAFIKKDFIERILQMTSLHDVVSSVVTLKRVGNGKYKGCCPFHGEKTPSFFLDDNKKVYYCFGCKAKGSITHFYKDYYHMSFTDTIVELSRRLGMEVEYEEEKALPGQLLAQRIEKEKVEQDLKILNFVDKLYQYSLGQNQKAKDYLISRKITVEMANFYHIGYAPEGNFLCNLAKDPSKFGISNPLEPLQRTVMVKASESNPERLYDVFRERIMFPIFNTSGEVVGFGGRTIVDHPSKYINSSNDSTVYNKSLELYGLYQVILKHRQLRKKIERIILVEGYLDVISLSQFGIFEGVAASGTAIQEGQLRQIYRNTNKLVMCFDGDAPGRNAAYKSLIQALSVISDEKQLSVVFLPNPEDPDSYLKKFGVNQFNKFLGNAQDCIKFLIEHELEQTGYKEQPTEENSRKFLDIMTKHYALLNDKAFIYQCDLLTSMSRHLNLPYQDVEHIFNQRKEQIQAELQAQKEKEKEYKRLTENAARTTSTLNKSFSSNSKFSDSKFNHKHLGSTSFVTDDSNYNKKWQKDKPSTYQNTFAKTKEQSSNGFNANSNQHANAPSHFSNSDAQPLATPNSAPNFDQNSNPNSNQSPKKSSGPSLDFNIKVVSRKEEPAATSNLDFKPRPTSYNRKGFTKNNDFTSNNESRFGIYVNSSKRDGRGYSNKGTTNSLDKTNSFSQSNDDLINRSANSSATTDLFVPNTPTGLVSKLKTKIQQQQHNSAVTTDSTVDTTQAVTANNQATDTVINPVTNQGTQNSEHSIHANTNTNTPVSNLQVKTPHNKAQAKESFEGEDDLGLSSAIADLREFSNSQQGRTRKAYGKNSFNDDNVLFNVDQIISDDPNFFQQGFSHLVLHPRTIDQATDNFTNAFISSVSATESSLNTNNHSFNTNSGFSTSENSFTSANNSNSFANSNHSFNATSNSFNLNSTSDSGFGANVNGFGTSESGFETSNSSFGTGVSGVGTSESGFETSNSSFETSVSGFGTGNSGFGTGMSGFGTSNSSFGTSNSSFETSLNGFGNSNSSFSFQTNTSTSIDSTNNTDSINQVSADQISDLPKNQASNISTNASNTSESRDQLDNITVTTTSTSNSTFTPTSEEQVSTIDEINFSQNISKDNSHSTVNVTATVNATVNTTTEANPATDHEDLDDLEDDIDISSFFSEQDLMAEQSNSLYQAQFSADDNFSLEEATEDSFDDSRDYNQNDSDSSHQSLTAVTTPLATPNNTQTTKPKLKALTNYMSAKVHEQLIPYHSHFNSQGFSFGNLYVDIKGIDLNPEVDRSRSKLRLIQKFYRTSRALEQVLGDILQYYYQYPFDLCATQFYFSTNLVCRLDIFYLISDLNYALNQAYKQIQEQVSQEQIDIILRNNIKTLYRKYNLKTLFEFEKLEQGCNLNDIFEEKNHYFQTNIQQLTIAAIEITHMYIMQEKENIHYATQALSFLYILQQITTDGEDSKKFNEYSQQIKDFIESDKIKNVCLKNELTNKLMSQQESLQDQTKETIVNSVDSSEDKSEAN